MASTTTSRQPLFSVDVSPSPLGSHRKIYVQQGPSNAGWHSLEADAGGEMQSHGVDDLVEQTIPRFTEIMDESLDVPLSFKDLEAPYSNGRLSPTQSPCNPTSASTRELHEDLQDLNFSTLSPTRSAKEPQQHLLDTSTSRGAARPGPEEDEEDDFLADLDRALDEAEEAEDDFLKDLDEALAKTDARPAMSNAGSSKDISSRPSSTVSRSSIPIKGRAAEFLPVSASSTTSHKSAPHSSNESSAAHSLRSSRPDDEQSMQRTRQARSSTQPEKASGTARPASPVSSFVSARGSQVTSEVSRVTLGTAAANWDFQSGSWSKPILRDATIESMHKKLPPGRALNLGGRSSVTPRNGLPTSSILANGRRTMQDAGPVRRGPPHPPRGFANQPHSSSPMLREPGPLENVEIRISNVPLDASKEDLYAWLSEGALHRHPFSTREHRMNFWIHLPKPKQQNGVWTLANSGTAYMTLPTPKNVHTFLGKYGRGNSAAIRIRGLIFERGSKAPPAGIVEWLQRMPFPAKGDRSQRVINDRKADTLSIARLEFGIFCRDGVYSSEYVKDMRTAKFSFDYRYRTLRISLLLQAARGQTPSTRLIVIKSSSIRMVLSSVEDDEYIATLILTHPPAYEELLSRSLKEEDVIAADDASSDQAQNKVENVKYTGRQRRPGWDHGHQKIANFTSRAIRLVFDSENLRHDFEDLLIVIGCSHAKYVTMQAEPRRLYATSKRRAINEWLNSTASRSVAFQLARLYHNNLLVPVDILALRPAVEELYAKKGPYITSDILHQYVEELTRLQEQWYDRIIKDRRHESEKELAQGVDVIQLLEDLVTRGINRVNWKEHHQSQLMQCLHVILTPTSMVLDGPYPDQSNRPLRKYGHHDHFVRVTFMDEDRQPYYWGPDIDWTAFLDERVGAILREGIFLAGKRYEFLGYSMSSLRSRSTWFCTPFEWEGQQVDADYIRTNLGDFERVKRQPARYGARMAQAFTATDPSIVLRKEEIMEIPDVEKKCRGETVCFTDGVGKISLSMTQRVWTALHHGMQPAGVLPSAFQFRLGGYKGVLAVDSALQGDKICVRPSQQKFDAPESLGLEVAYTYTSAMPMFLNRPLIKVLEDLEVPPEAFLNLMQDAIGRAEDLKIHIRETRKQLTLHELGRPFDVKSLVEHIGSLLKTNRIEPFKHSGRLASFVADSLEFAEVHILRLLKLKARIPVHQAHVGVAIADESGVLKAGEIYTLRHDPGEPPRAVEGDVLLVRAPTVDVGDVQYARAVGHPPPGAERLHDIPNAVVFSIHGDEPLITSLSRGDMDGDLVGVIYDRRLFPKKTERAMQHKPKKAVDLPYDCTINEVIDFVLRFFRNDMLGLIANRHLLIADQAPSGFVTGSGTRHPACKILAELQTIAVDAPKSGQSVDLSEMPRPLFPHRPDFASRDLSLMSGEPEEETLIYQSRNILGRLYRSISLTSQEMENQTPKEAEPLDNNYIPAGEDDQILIALLHELELCGLQTSRQASDESCRTDAWYAMHSYANDLRHIAWSNTMNSGHPLTEHELFITTILHGPWATKQKQELLARIGLQSKDLIDSVLLRLEGSDGRDRPQQWTNRVLAALRVAVSQGAKFGASTFALIAVRSCLNLLTMMREVHRAQMFANHQEADVEEPFRPVHQDQVSFFQSIPITAFGSEEGILGPAT